MVGARIVESFAVRDQHAEHRAEFEKLMPVAIVAGQARSVEADHEPGITKADFGNQLLKGMTLDVAGAGFAEVLIDDMHAPVRPSQSNGPIDQPVLQLGTLLMLTNLGQG